MLEDLKEEDIDRNIPGIKVGDDPLSRIIQFCCDKNDLVRIVKSLLIQIHTKVLLECISKISSMGKALINLYNFIGGELFYP